MIDFPENFEQLRAASRVLKQDHSAVVGVYREKLLWKYFDYPTNVLSRELLTRKIKRNWRLVKKLQSFESVSTAAYIQLEVIAGQGLCLVQEYVPEDNLGCRVMDLKKLDEAQRHSVLTLLAGQLANIHAAGFAHGDAKWGNILAANDFSAFSFVDLDGVSPLTKRKRFKDLARFLADMDRFGFGNTDFLTFLAAYAKTENLLPVNLLKGVWPVYSKIRYRHLESSFLQTVLRVKL